MAAGVPASMGRRLLAALADGALALLAVGVPTAVAVRPVLADPTDPTVAPGAGWLVAGWVLLLALGVTQWVLLGRRGWTLGKRAAGVLVLSERSGFPPGLGAAFLRLLVPGLANLLPVLGPVVVHLSPFFDATGRRQGWHDKAAGTVVVDARHVAAPRTAEVERRLQHLLTPDAGRGERAVDGPHVVPAAVDTTVPGPITDRSPADADRADTDRADTDLADTGMVRRVPGVTSSVPSPSRPADQASAAEPTRPIARGTDAAAHADEPAVHVSVPAGVASGHGLPPTRALVPGTRVVPPPDVVSDVPFPSTLRREDEDVEATRLRPARAKVPELAAQELEVTVELTDGQRVTFSGSALIGRNPTPRPGEDGCRLITVADPGRSVSKTHLLLGVDRNGPWVRDRHSTNGTVVTLADGQQILCGADQQVRLPPGASVAFGDYGLSVATVDAV